MSNRLTPALLQDCHDRITAVLVDALGVDDDEVTPNTELVGDLGAEDIDFLDIVFRMEKSFDLEIPRSEIIPEHMFPQTEGGQLVGGPSDRFGIWRTVQDLVDYVVRKRVNTGELVVETEMLRFFLGPDGRILVSMSMEDGSWGYADGTRTLPSHLVFVDKGNWSTVLQELEDLINDPRVSEQDLQGFLERHPELVKGGDYDRVVSQAVLCPTEYESDWRMDFVARPIDQNQFVKILELKKPQVPLVKKSKFDQNPFSAQLYEAIQQLRRYSRAFHQRSVRQDFCDRYGIDVYRPDMHLIAGRSWDISLSDRFRDFMRDEQVFVENWDAALERMKRKFT